MNEKKNIIIIGAGVAGLNAAQILARNGFKVKVFEAASSCGGRAKSFIDTTSGDTIDNGQHILIGAYTEFLDFLGNINVRDNLLIQKSLKTDFISEGKIYSLDTGKFFGNLGYLLGFVNFKLLSNGDKIKIAAFYLKLKLNLIKHNNPNTYNLLKSNNQSDELIKIFWEPLIISAMNTNIHEASSKIFINVMQQGFFKNKQAAGLIIPKISFSELFDKIINNDFQIFYNQRVTKINDENNQIKSIIANGEEHFADYYISAVPPFVLKSLIDDKNFAYLSDFEYSPIVSAYLWFADDKIRIPFANFVNGNFDWVFNKSVIDLKKSSFAKGFYSFTKSCAVELMNMNNNAILELILKDMQNNFNIDDKPIHYRIIKEKFATIKSDINSDSIRPECITNFTNFFLAGEWTATGFPSTLEGAALSGKNAAATLLKTIERD